MKKNFFAFAVMLTGSALFTACLNNDNDAPNSWQGLVSSGAYIVNGGEYSSLAYLDYEAGTVSQRHFEKVNGRQLGSQANDVMVYGSKMYIVVSGENTIEVVDPKTGMSIRQLNTVGLAGEKGTNPRHVSAANGMIYVSTYGDSSHEYDEEGGMVTSGNGYVTVIDTVSFSLKNVYAVGSYPEGLYATTKNVYVANSDCGAVKNASVSIIDLTAGTETQMKHSNIRNPQDVVGLTDGSYFILDWGESDADGKQMNAGVYLASGDNVTKRIDNATMWAPVTFYNNYTGSASSYLYTVNAPKGASTITYERYDLSNGSRMTFTTDGVFCPIAIEVDPIAGFVFIASYKENSTTHEPAYDANGYVKVYDPNSGKCIKEFDCGVRPNAFAFNTEIKTITY